MAEKMLSYIKSQPAVWRTICEHQTEIVSQCVTLLREKKPRRIVFVGSGSSNYAARIAAFLNRRIITDITWNTAVPTRLDELGGDLSDTVALAVSQSGKSTSTRHAMKLLHERGAIVVSVTSDEGSPIASEGDIHLYIPCGEERVGPKTKGMTATVLTLFLLGLELAKESGKLPGGRLSMLYSAFEAAYENIQRSLDYAKRVSPLLAKAPYLTLIADGVGLPIAEEGALKLLETLYIPASAWEFEEYIHGINNIIGPESYHVFLLQNTENFGRMKKLIEYCESKGCEVFIINCSGQELIFRNTMDLVCSGSPETLPYEALIPYQVLSAVVSEKKNIQCDKPRYPDFYAALGTKTDARTGEA